MTKKIFCSVWLVKYFILPYLRNKLQHGRQTAGIHASSSMTQKIEKKFRLPNAMRLSEINVNLT